MVSQFLKSFMTELINFFFQGQGKFFGGKKREEENSLKTTGEK